MAFKKQNINTITGYDIYKDECGYHIPTTFEHDFYPVRPLETFWAKYNRNPYYDTRN